MSQVLTLSSLGHTWILDLDGTIVKHNGYKLDGFDTLLDGAEVFIKSLPTEDRIVFITSRTSEYRESTEQFLKRSNIRWDHIIYDAPYGERILVNDRKPSGLDTALAVNVGRNAAVGLNIEIDTSL